MLHRCIRPYCFPAIAQQLTISETRMFFSSIPNLHLSRLIFLLFAIVTMVGLASGILHPPTEGTSSNPTTSANQETENRSETLTLNNIVKNKNHSKIPPGLKTILYHTPFFVLKNYGFGEGQKPFLDKCRIKDFDHTNCFATSDREALPSVGDFDALMFHPLNFLDNMSQLVVPSIPERQPHQRFVMFMKEAPLNPKHFFYGKYSERRPNFSYESLKGFFNWTMTYRLDSDIPVPHNWMELRSQNMITSPFRRKDLFKWPKFDMAEFEREMRKDEHFKRRSLHKKGLVAWMVSHCWTNSNREAFVIELSKYIQVDIFGGCSKRDCNTECFHKMRQDYKFYLAFENNICKDYVTEKFWGRLDTTIPIVMGSYQYKDLAPPHSYIQAEDFPSMRELADYLYHLDKNDLEYDSYFWWQWHYRRGVPGRSLILGMCELCRKLNNKEEPVTVVEDLEDWWWTQSECKPFPQVS